MVNQLGREGAFKIRCYTRSTQLAFADYYLPTEHSLQYVKNVLCEVTHAVRNHLCTLHVRTLNRKFDPVQMPSLLACPFMHTHLSMYTMAPIYLSNNLVWCTKRTRDNIIDLTTLGYISATLNVPLSRDTEGGGEWSANVFLRNWRNMDKRSKNILFGAPRFKEVSKELDSLARLAEVAVENIGEINRSRSGVTTAGYAQIGATIVSLGAAGGLAFAGDFTGAGSMVAYGGGALLAPRYAAKLMTSPKFIRWLKTTAQATNRGVNPLAVQLGRLAVLPGKDPELAEAVNAFVSNIQANIAGQ